MKTKDNELLNLNIGKLLGAISVSVISIVGYTKSFKKTLQEVHILTKFRSYISIPQTELQINAFFASQFNYCPLVWMSSIVCYGKAPSDMGMI